MPELAKRARLRRAGVDAIRRHQLDHVRALVAHAAARVPAYADVLTPAHAARLNSFDDIASLPMIDKAHLLRTEDGWWMPRDAPHMISTTSGTTGEPIAIPWSEHARWMNWVHSLRMMRAMHAPFTGRQYTITLPERRGAPVRTGIRSLLANRRLRLSEAAPPDELADAICEGRPRWVTGQPHVLARVADALAGRHRPALVTTHGCSVDRSMREQIARGFGTFPLDIFGATEALHIGWQCHAGDLYHVNHEALVVEVLDDDGAAAGPGEPGHLVVTSLLNTLLPIIRYRIGDGVVLADRPCACGDPLPALQSIQGRVLDWIVGMDGKRIPPQRFWLTSVASSEAEARVRRYRLRQNADRSVLVELVPREPLDAPFLAHLEGAFRSALGDGIPFEIRLVDQIDVPPGQRFREFMSAATPSR